MAKRRAGEILRSVDNKYADAVVDMFMGKKGQERTFGGNPAVQATAGMGAIYLGGTPWEARGSLNTAPGSAYTSAAARYGAPVAAAGLGSAVVGGTTNAIFGGPEDGQQPGQLDLGSLTVGALVGAGTPLGLERLTNIYRNEAGIAPMNVTNRQRIGISAASAGATMLANALGQAIF